MTVITATTKHADIYIFWSCSYDLIKTDTGTSILKPWFGLFVADE